MSLDQIFAELEPMLRGAGVSHAVIGAYAVAAWGEVRGTRDLDLLVETTDVARLLEALRGAGREHEFRAGDAEDPIAFVIRLHATLDDEQLPVDILAGIRGAPAGIVARARPVVVGPVTARVATPEDMILLKLRAGSARDIADARSIVRVQGVALSRPLLDEICPSDLEEPLGQLLGSA